MSDDLQRLEEWVRPLIAKLAPAERRQLARRVAQDLRRSQQTRIREQRNPDGSPYAPRSTASALSGRIRRRAMFSKLRTNRYMKITATSSAAEVGFMGRIASIARVHQEGRRTRVAPNGPFHSYPTRALLGFAPRDEALVRDSMLNHLRDLGH